MKLFIHFDGVLGFVPSPTRDAMTVILVNALRPTHGHGAPHGTPHGSPYDNGWSPEAGTQYEGDLSHHCIPPHYPYLSFDAECLVNSDVQRDVVFETDGTDGDILWARFFRWQDLCVVRQVPSCKGLEIMGGRKPGAAEPHGDGDEGDFSWLAEMHKIDPELGEVDPRCLLPDPPRNLVIGRVRLDSGCIFTDELAGPSPDDPVLWEFKTPDGSVVSPLCQVLASRIVWETEIDDPTVTLRLTRFGPGPHEDICLKPKQGNDWIQVDVGNLPLEGLLRLEGGAYAREELLYHFPAVLRLARKQGCRIYIPSIVPDSDHGGLVRAGTTICIGGTFSG
jgi:hypothetical protein